MWFGRGLVCLDEDLGCLVGLGECGSLVAADGVLCRLFVFWGVVSKTYWCVWGGGCVVVVGRGRGLPMMGAATQLS